MPDKMDTKITINNYVAQVLNADFNELLELRDPPLESFLEYKDIGENEFDLIYGSWYERLNDFEPLLHEQKIALIPFDEIDERLQAIIKRLNTLKLYTRFCCQGVDSKTYTELMNYLEENIGEPAYYPNGDEAPWPEFPNGTQHSQYADITFEDYLPDELLDLIATKSDKIRSISIGKGVESTKMKFNPEFPKELDRILDEWEKLKDT